MNFNDFDSEDDVEVGGAIKAKEKEMEEWIGEVNIVFFLHKRVLEGKY